MELNNLESYMVVHEKRLSGFLFTESLSFFTWRSAVNI